MNNIEIISIVVVVVLAGILGVKYLIANKIAVEEIVDNVHHGIDIIQIILDAVPIPEGNKIGISKVLDIADQTATSVFDLYESLKQGGSMLKVALDAVKGVLNELDIQPTDAENRLIETVVSESLKWLGKENK